MFATGDPVSHEEAWLALPWLANGRISQVERDKVEPHVRTCSACRQELAFQRLLCNILAEPDRVSYAPGPSFRKLLHRIDGVTSQRRKTPTRAVADRPRSEGGAGSLHVSWWRPPGLAWAASFILLVGLTGIVGALYQSSQPTYTTRTDTARIESNVLHIAFDRSVTIGEAEEALRSSNAHIVEGPDSTGVFGVSPGISDSRKITPRRASQELSVLSARLRADPRVRWVEPVPEDNSPGKAQAPISRGP
jgi:hypothetical protein